VQPPPTYSPDIRTDVNGGRSDEGLGASQACNLNDGAPCALPSLPDAKACAEAASRASQGDDGDDDAAARDGPHKTCAEAAASGGEGAPGAASHEQKSEQERVECLCVHCLHFVSAGNGDGDVCRHHCGVFDAELTARPRTIVPLAPHKIALLVDFQRVQIMFHAPVPVGESGCTNPHLFAIEGRTSAACGFAAISHYEVVVDGGLSGRITLPGAQAEAASQLDITGVFPNSDTALQDQGAFLEQRAIDEQDARPPLAGDSLANGLPFSRPPLVGEAAKRVLESGGAAAVWHSIRIISRTRQDAARPFLGWRGDESEEIFFTMPEISRPIVAVEHVGDGKQVRVTWSLPVAVGGATVLDFVRVRWRRVAGGRPVDLDSPQDGMPSHFIQGTFDPLSKPAWGLKGASARDAISVTEACHRGLGLVARDATGEKEVNTGKIRAHAECGASDDLSENSRASSRNSSHDGEWGWMEQTVPLNNLAFTILLLTEGALYQVEVEASGKYVGPVLAAAPHPTASKHAQPLPSEDTNALTSLMSDDGGTTRRTLDTGSMASEHASEAQSIMGLFGEEAGAEQRRGAPSSDAGTEQWERNIDAFSRQALLEQHLDTLACPYDEEAISSRLTQRADSTGGPCAPSSTLGVAVRGRFPVTRSASATSPRSIKRVQAPEMQGQASARVHTSGSKSTAAPPRLMLPKERSCSPRRKASGRTTARVMDNLTARSWTQSELNEAQHAPATEFPPVWTENGWTGAHVQKSLDRYSSVLRDRRKSHVIDIALPKYSSDREVSKQLQFTALRRPRPAGRPTVFFACSCDVDIPVDLEDAMLQPVDGRKRYCSNSLTVWWFRPEEFEPVLISGYNISDALGRSFWVSRHHSELLASILARQGRLPQNLSQPSSSSSTQGSTVWSDFVACAFILPVEACSWNSVHVQVPACTLL